MISTITGTVTTTVEPGSGTYAAALTIANTGAIDSQPDAIAAQAIGVSITNLGNIDGNIRLYLDSTLNNAGMVTAATAVSLDLSDAVQNTGKILGGEIGVNLGLSCRVSNSGLIEGGNVGVFAPDGGYIVNNGTIRQTGGVGGPMAFGVDLDAATLNNKGTVSGFYAVEARNGSSVTNSGVIYGQNLGIIGSLDDQITNTGLIHGNFTAIYFYGGTVTNSGTINAILNGIDVTNNVLIVNSGSLYGGGTGIGLMSGGEVINSGTIASATTAILNSNTSLALTITAEAGVQFSGQVDDESKHGVVILGGTAAGTLDMGNSFIGFSKIIFDPGVKWVLEGSVQELADGETIIGFTTQDAIELNNFTVKSDSFVSGKGLILSNGVSTETLDITGNLSTADFTLATVSGQTVVEAVTAPCFCAGTRIATAHGNVAVERLAVGDLVKTATNGLQPIRWIGRRSYDGRFIAGNHLALPVKIRRHAFGFNVPSRDLYLSPDHAVCEGGVLVHAWRFINGVSVTQAQSVDRVAYFHIELDNHAVIFAENTPVESFLDTGCRNRFQNADSAPEDLTPQEPCLPRVEDGYYLARLRARIDARAGLTPPAGVNGPLRGNVDETGQRLCGWAQDEAAPERPVELELLYGGQMVLRFLANRYRKDLRGAGLGSGCHAFDLAMPALSGPFTLRRVDDGALLGPELGWKTEYAA